MYLEQQKVIKYKFRNEKRKIHTEKKKINNYLPCVLEMSISLITARSPDSESFLLYNDKIRGRMNSKGEINSESIVFAMIWFIALT